jgi:hypothetical protein
MLRSCKGFLRFAQEEDPLREDRSAGPLSIFASHRGIKSRPYMAPPKIGWGGHIFSAMPRYSSLSEELERSSKSSGLRNETNLLSFRRNSIFFR